MATTLFQVPRVPQSTIHQLITMASSGRKRKLPNWVAKSLECPVCLETIKDPPVYLCEKGHGLCQTCREPLKTQNLPCPVCRGKLTDARSLAVEDILEQMPKIKCKYEGCTFGRSDVQIVKKHEDECKERPITCQICLKPIALSKLFGHLETLHDKKPMGCTNLGQKYSLWTLNPHPHGITLLVKVNNDLEFVLNIAPYDENVTMFWISLFGTTKEAKEYEYTLTLENKDRTKILATKTTKCLSCDMSRADVKKKGMVLLLSLEDLRQAENNDQNLYWTVLIEKK